MSDEELYGELLQYLQPLLDFFETLDDPEKLEACMVYTILCAVRNFDLIPSLGLLERIKYLLLSPPKSETSHSPFVV